MAGKNIALLGIYPTHTEVETGVDAHCRRQAFGAPTFFRALPGAPLRQAFPARSSGAR